MRNMMTRKYGTSRLPETHRRCCRVVWPLPENRPSPRGHAVSSQPFMVRHRCGFHRNPLWSDIGAVERTILQRAAAVLCGRIKAKRVECFAKFCARRQPWTENARSRDGRPPFWERPGRALPNPEEYPVPRN
jgi:hypothetical protein